jgi:hypothetical protein
VKSCVAEVEAKFADLLWHVELEGDVYSGEPTFIGYFN